MFSSSTEPIVADDWLRRIGRELTTAGCTDAEKVRFAAHQLEEVLIITMAPRMETGMEQAAIRTALTQPHPPRRT